MTLGRLHTLVVPAAILLTVAGGIAWPPGVVPVLWIPPLLGAVSLAFLGAVEPALVAVLSAAAGVLWAATLLAVLDVKAPPGAPAAGWVAGTAVALPMVLARLERFRGRQDRASRRAAGVACAAAAGLALWTGVTRPPWTPYFALPPLAAAVLGRAGMDVLLFMDGRRGLPRLPWLLGAILGLVHIVVAQLALLLAALPVHLLPGDPGARLRRIGRLGPRSLFRLFPYGKLEWFGIDRHAFERPAVVVSNHQSAVDVLLVLALPADIRLTLGLRVWRAPTLGIAARSLGHILVEPDRPEATLEACARRMRENGFVHFFPEGTRSEDAFPRRFRRGAFDVAVGLGCDVLPILLCDTRGCIPRDAFWVERFHMSVKALPRITPRTFDYAKGPDALRRHVQETVRAAFLEEHARIHTPGVLRRKVARRYRYLGLATGLALRRGLAAARWLELLGSVLPSRGRILDAGCGLGLASHWLAELHPRLQVVGVDGDADRIRVACRSAAGSPRVTFVCGALEEVPGPFDGALLRPGAVGSLEPTLRALIGRLRPAAPLFVPDPDEEHRRVLAAAGFVPSGAVYVREPSA